MSILDHALNWPQQHTSSSTPTEHSLTSSAWNSPAGLPLKHEIPSPTISSLGPYPHGNYESGFGSSSSLYGLDLARESRARWSAAGSDSNSSKGTLERLGFKLHLGGDKKTRDGQQPKRRGPKPDSKPALTRRQELNRQAQRTHRERKEMYIKALEQEVLRLKEVFETTTKERDAYMTENQRLKEILLAHGIQYDITSPNHPYQSASSQFGGSSTSLTGSNTRNSMSTGITSPPSRGAAPPIPHPLSHSPSFDQQQAQYQQSMQQARPNQNQVDYDQVGIDFVLTLERPCMDHMQFLMIRSEDSDGEISGHALMATCPPAHHIANHPEEKYPHKMPEIGMPDLLKLLDLSNRLPLDGEITPIMAWAGIRNHPRSCELTKEDFETLRDDLLAKIRCYGFGAVLEEFEVKDALSSTLAKKLPEGQVYTPDMIGFDGKPQTMDTTL